MLDRPIIGEFWRTKMKRFQRWLADRATSKPKLIRAIIPADRTCGSNAWSGLPIAVCGSITASPRSGILSV